MDNTEINKIKESFNLLESKGIFMTVPGWFDLTDADEAVEFAINPDKFYAKRNVDYSRG